LLFSSAVIADQKSVVIDNFDTLSGWNKANTDKTVFDIISILGIKGGAIDMKFDFKPAQGYVVMGKNIPIRLSDDCQFQFYIKGNCQPNNLEFKLMDRDGNCFWKKFPNYVFPHEWTELTVKKSDLIYAWGPNSAAVASRGYTDRAGRIVRRRGSGDVAFDDLRMTGAADTAAASHISATASSFDNPDLAPERQLTDLWDRDGRVNFWTING